MIDKKQRSKSKHIRPRSHFAENGQGWQEYRAQFEPDVMVEHHSKKDLVGNREYDRYTGRDKR